MLQAARHGDRAALDRLVPLVYAELTEIARRQLRARDRAMHTASLVHEAYLRLIDQRVVAWQDRAHFFAVAATLMRRIMIDRIRAERAAKRGGTAVTVVLDDALAATPAPLSMLEVLRLHDALEALEALDAVQARIVELRVFGGLTVEETALVVGVSPRTVKREWSMGRAFLLRTLGEAA